MSMHLQPCRKECHVFLTPTSCLPTSFNLLVQFITLHILLIRDWLKASLGQLDCDTLWRPLVSDQAK